MSITSTVSKRNIAYKQLSKYLLLSSTDVSNTTNGYCKLKHKTDYAQGPFTIYVTP